MNDTVIHERRDGYDILTLNQPERLNPFNEKQHEALAAAFEEIENNPECRAVILTGAGRGFCAGQDLGERDFANMKDAPDLGAGLEKNYNPLVRRMRGLDKPVVCAVNGVAAGAGANIALACDIVIAARSASFIQVFARIGLIPDAGGTWWLTQRLGEARAKALAFTTEPLTAEKAAEWGLIWKAVDDESLMDEAIALATTFANGPANAYALAKKAIQAASSNSLDAQLDLERTLQREAGLADEYREGVTAFHEKRKPNFRKR
ncbi:MAG: 2-(1,2-epoxy-1,2-dihydrophenyl)acetyl-CoA isomerase [Rhizobiaceae bacterium]|nr:2-(1,2-epoxy-1,2-dihydrophenyl)acetyl-CoA isomerase [Rhizobiaceae bacterium]